MSYYHVPTFEDMTWPKRWLKAGCNLPLSCCHAALWYPAAQRPRPDRHDKDKTFQGPTCPERRDVWINQQSHSGLQTYNTSRAARFLVQILQDKQHKWAAFRALSVRARVGLAACFLFVFVLAGGGTDAANEWLITLNSVKKQKHQRQHQQRHGEMQQQQPGNENSSHLRRCCSPQLREEGFISVVSLSSLHFQLGLITKCPDLAMWNKLIKKTNEQIVCLFPQYVSIVHLRAEDSNTFSNHRSLKSALFCGCDRD